MRQQEEAALLIEMLGGLTGVDFGLTVDDPLLDAAPSAMTTSLYVGVICITDEMVDSDP